MEPIDLFIASVACLSLVLIIALGFLVISVGRGVGETTQRKVEAEARRMKQEIDIMHHDLAARINGLAKPREEE